MKVENKEFEYKVSVIIPVYNVEDYIRRCLDSIVMQTMDMSQVEVLLIDDGSKDNSLTICREYADLYPYFKVFHQENSGVSVARNFGIRNAKGKYIMYLDADDLFTENVLKEVSNFFDKYYDEIDVVTYPERTYSSDGQMKTPHIRYQVLKKTGVYDLTKDIYVFQTRLNIATKNLYSDNLLFDEQLGYHEDQKYCSELLKDKMKIGFIDGVEYRYMLHSGSIVAENTNPIVLFEPTTKYWENLFAEFEDDVPEYYQALYVHDLSWKLSQNYLLPYHYHGEKFKKSVDRLWTLLRRVSDHVILTHPSVDNFHRYYFLQKKGNAITPIVEKGRYLLASEGEIIFERKSFELVFNKMREKNGKLLLLLTLKSQFFNFHEKPHIYVNENDGEQRHELEVFFSSRSYYKCKTITNHFWAFYYECDMSSIHNFKFEIDVDGIIFPTHYYRMPTSPFVMRNKISRNGYLIEMKNNEFFITKASEGEEETLEKENTQAIREHSYEAYRVRTLSHRYVGKRIWLYYDCKGVDYDNGYLQFIHDFEKADGIDRYYVLNNDFDESRHLFTESQLSRVVMFGSELHQQLFIRAERIITAYIEEVNLYPFAAAGKNLYMDLMNAEIVYLQHGILHASLPWKYTPERLEVDKVVASSYFEVKNFHEKYLFRKEDILPYGMPRFEKMDRNAKPVNRILFAPSWRMYLIGQCIDTVWELTEDKFVESKYYLEMQKFLDDPRLTQLLEKNDLYLDFKIHPIFRPYLKFFTITSDRVSIADNVVKDEEYALFITDFSSYTFNFAYLKRPIIYFVPDILEFEAGLNQYRRLDLPFEEAFGDFTTEVDQVIESVKTVVDHHFEVEEKYKKRMNEFYLPMEQCCEKIYRAIL